MVKVPNVPGVPKVPNAPRARQRTGGSRLQAALAGRELSLLDLVDSLIDRGALVNADVTLGLANVDLVYIRLSALIAAADRILAESRPKDDSPQKTVVTQASRPARKRRSRR